MELRLGLEEEQRRLRPSGSALDAGASASGSVSRIDQAQLPLEYLNGRWFFRPAFAGIWDDPAPSAIYGVSDPVQTTHSRRVTAGALAYPGQSLAPRHLS